MTQIDNTPMKETVAMAVAYIIKTREERKKPPYMATMTNIKNVVAQTLESALEELTKEGMLLERRTLNEKAYEFNPPK